MSKAFRFELNSEGVRELLKSEQMISTLEHYADGIAARAGDGYDVHIGANRANVSVRTATNEAAQDNLDNNTLLKAVRG